MAVSGERPARRPRYLRQPHQRPVDLSPERTRGLVTVARYGLITVRQLAALTGVCERSVRRTMRPLFDAGWVEVVPLPRVALPRPEAANEAALAWGSAPNLYVLTRAGAKLLRELGLVNDAIVLSGRYGPRNSLFLAHELAIRDVRVWFERSAGQHENHRLEVWRDGTAAEIALPQQRPPRVVRPDAWAVYRIGPSALVGLVEVDMGTERGLRGGRWQQKIVAFQALFEAGVLKEVTGYARARVLVLAPDARRRDSLATFIAEHAPPWLAERFWLIERVTLTTPDIHTIAWRQPGRQLLRPLLAREPSATAVGAVPAASPPSETGKWSAR